MKLIMMRGLPASGKSTRAREIMAEGGNFVRVNRDDLRAMLHTGKWSGKKEDVTKKIQMEIVDLLLTGGNNVIIDDTNLRPQDEEKWKGFAKEYNAKFEIIDMDMDVFTCIALDSQREKSVGENVIWKMALSSGRYKSERKYVLVDIDGTLADISHRLHYVQGEKKDWDGFFLDIEKDKPREEVIRLMIEAKKDYEVFVVSGRPERYRENTLDWLCENGVPGFTALIMRGADDKRPDTMVKQDILKCFGVENVGYVIDDRPCVIKMWRDNGVKCIDVGNGVDF
jgi:predicted kinase